MKDVGEKVAEEIVAFFEEASTRRLLEALKKAGLRVECDLRNEKINYKVREHSLTKTPVIAVVGRREAEEGNVALRRFGSDRQEVISLVQAVRTLAIEAVPPDLAIRAGDDHASPRLNVGPGEAG